MNFHFKKISILPLSGSKNWLTFFALLIINCLFVFKYSSRIWGLSNGLYITFFYSLLFYFILLLPQIFKEKTLFLFVIFGAIIYLILNIIFLNVTDPNSTNVDRWSVITTFWNFAFQGKYPYDAKSNMQNNPGPFPFYFILALPFYLLNEIGLFSLFGLYLLIFLILKRKTATEKNSITCLLILSSASIWWETLMRSTILINGTLIVAFILLLIKCDLKKKSKLIILGIFAGLLLSTRGLVVLPYTICFTFLFLKKFDLKPFLIFGISVFTSFVLTFIPFIIYDYQKFLKVNPILIQSDYFLPISFLLFFLFLAIILGFLIKNKLQIIQYSGITLLLTMVFYFFYHTYQTNFKDAYLGSQLDISYFIFIIPFLIYNFYDYKESENFLITIDKPSANFN